MGGFCQVRLGAIMAVFSLVGIVGCHPAATTPPAMEAKWSTSVVGQTYAGSITCQKCYESEYALWSLSHHAIAERPVQSLFDQTAFAPPRSFRHGSQTTDVAVVNGRFQFELGLAWNEAGDLAQAQSAFESAVKLAPNHALAWYNLGLARSATRHPQAAIEALLRAESADTTDPRAPYARAMILARLEKLKRPRLRCGTSWKFSQSFRPRRNSCAGFSKAIEIKVNFNSLEPEAYPAPWLLNDIGNVKIRTDTSCLTVASLIA